MKRIRSTLLTLPSGQRIRLGFGSCLRCRRLVGTCTDAAGPHVWDGIGFDQAAKLQFADHACPVDSRRDLARDAKMEADRDPR